MSAREAIWAYARAQDAHRMDEHVQEVLARGNGWQLRGRWPVLDVHSPDYSRGPVGAYIIVHEPVTDTWGRTYIRAGESVDVPPAVLCRQAWTLGYFSAAAAAEEIEQLVWAVPA